MFTHFVLINHLIYKCHLLYVLFSTSMFSLFSYSSEEIISYLMLAGIETLMTEVVEEPSEIRKSGVSVLLSHVMRITSSRLHSRTETVLPLLVDESSFNIDGQNFKGLYLFCMPLFSYTAWFWILLCKKFIRN